MIRLRPYGQMLRIWGLLLPPKGFPSRGWNTRCLASGTSQERRQHAVGYCSCDGCAGRCRVTRLPERPQSPSVAAEGSWGGLRCPRRLPNPSISTFTLTLLPSLVKHFNTLSFYTIPPLGPRTDNNLIHHIARTSAATPQPCPVPIKHTFPPTFFETTGA